LALSLISEQTNTVFTLGEGLPSAKIDEFAVDAPAEEVLKDVLAQGSAKLKIVRGQYLVQPLFETISRIDCDQQPVRTVLRTVFRNAGVSYTVAPEIQGSVTFHVSNIPLTDALDYLLSQVHAGYRIEGGVFNIIPNGPEKGRSNKATLDVKDMDVRSVILDIFKDSDEGFALSPAVQGQITANLKEAPVSELLAQIAKQVGVSVTKRGHIYWITPGKGQ